MEKRTGVNLLRATFSVIFGLVVIFFYTETVSLVVSILAIYLIIDGLLEIAHSMYESSKTRGLITGALSFLVGLLLILNSQAILALFVYIVSAKFLIESLSHIFFIFREKRLKLELDEYIDIGKNILIVGISVWLIFTPIGSLSTLFLLLGIYAFVTGSISLLKSRKDIYSSIRSINLLSIWRTGRPYIASGLGYGFGFLIGTTLLYLVFSLEEAILFESYQNSQRNFLGVILFLIIVGAHGLLVGSLGSFLLSWWNDEILDKRKYIIRNSLGLSIAGIIITIPLVLTLFGVSFLSNGETPLFQSIIIFSIFGAIYGIISSIALVFRNFTKNRSYQTISYMTVGYAVGGALLGIGFWNFIFSNNSGFDSIEGYIWLILGVFLFGFASGVSTLMAARFVHKVDIESLKIDERKTELTTFFDRLTGSDWFQSHTTKRFIGLTILILIVVGVTFTFILNRPKLASSISANTEGTHWVIERDLSADQIKIDQSNYSNDIDVNCEEQRTTLNTEDNSVEFDLNCADEITPVTVETSDGNYHIFWVSNQVENIFGELNDNEVLYESIYDGEEFSLPLIVAEVTEPKNIIAGFIEEKTLAVVLENGSDRFQLATNNEYKCEVDTDSEIVKRSIEVAQEFHPEIQYPFCQNRFDNLIYTPNPDEAFSEDQSKENGAYDYFKEIITDAKYEVQISNMWYDKDVNRDSPGNYISEGVAELYEKIQENPENYPRGINIKIMLGNPPEFLLLDTEGQIWSALEDLRGAGVDKLIDEDLGWKVEVANFAGALPHSHTKQVIIDGKTVIAAGINIQYKHLPKDHQSGQGNDRVDNAIQITGPVAQLSMAAFDDTWDGADIKHCNDFYPNPEDSWRLTCDNRKAEVSHVPEVLRYYIPQDADDSNYLSLYRSLEYKEADKVLGEAIAKAEKSIDILQVNFSLDLICDLNVLVNVCTFEHSPQYMHSILEAMRNGAKVRVLTKETPIEGLENKIAIDELMKVVEEEGLEENIEIRYFDGEFHSKVVQLDEEFVVIGSQNFHYSAWGKSGLTEFNGATDNPEANEEIARFFNYHWEQGKDIE